MKCYSYCGGSWFSYSRFFTIQSFPCYNKPIICDSGIGFRLIKTIKK